MTTPLHTLPEPRHPDPRHAPVLRWGILGPGGIAQDFAKALLGYSDQRIVAVGSRDAERAAEFAARFEIERSYGSYEELVADPEVDVVYVSSPHSEHERHALLAIAAGKHVLIEKPIATTRAEAQSIADAAARAGVFAMEAMWTRHLPHMDVARQLLEDDVLGDVHVVTADFSFASSFDPQSRMWNPALGGGALLDLGVYVVSMAVFAMGLPEHVHAIGTVASTGVDDQVALVLTGNGGASQGLLSVGLHSPSPAGAWIGGSAGLIQIPPAFWSPSDLRVTIGREEPLEWHDPSDIRGRMGFAYEAAAVARYVGDGLTDSPLNPIAEAIEIVGVLEEARRQLG
jgi:predicted dehydrogenase